MYVLLVSTSCPSLVIVKVCRIGEHFRRVTSEEVFQHVEKVLSTEMWELHGKCHWNLLHTVISERHVSNGAVTFRWWRRFPSRSISHFLWPFVFPASTALHQDWYMKTCSDQTIAGAKPTSVHREEHPRGMHLPVRREGSEAERGERPGRGAQGQQMPVVLLTHAWKPTEQHGVISQGPGP